MYARGTEGRGWGGGNYKHIRQRRGFRACKTMGLNADLNGEKT